MAETRTITTRGQFHNVTNLRWELYSVATITSENNCPHEFRLQRRKPGTTSPFSFNELDSLEGELVVYLSNSVYEMYSDWTMTWEFKTPSVTLFGSPSVTLFGSPSGESQVISQVTITPNSDPVAWETIVVGKARTLLANHQFSGGLHFTVTWSRQGPFPELEKTQRELEELKKAMTQMRTSMFETFNRPSIDITHLVFCSRRNGNFKHLYVPSHVLERFEYFQRCHSAEYAETQDSNGSHLKENRTGSLSEGLFSDDSDEEWDSDLDNVEPEKVIDPIGSRAVHARSFAK